MTRLSALLPRRSDFRHALLSGPSPLPLSLINSSEYVIFASPFAGGQKVQPFSNSLLCCPLEDGDASKHPLHGPFFDAAPNLCATFNTFG